MSTNGMDWLGFDDLVVEYDGDRTIALNVTRGDLCKAFTFVLPFQKYQGVFQQGKSYNVGDTVTYMEKLWSRL